MILRPVDSRDHVVIFLSAAQTSTMSYLRSTHLVEGFGDEVLYSIGAFLGILVPMIVYIVNGNR